MIVRSDSFLARLVMLLPRRWFFIHSIRIGSNFNDYVEILRRK
jgi:hypothetical protein